MKYRMLRNGKIPTGGVRPQPGIRLICPPDCRRLFDTTFWSDYVVYIPDLSEPPPYPIPDPDDPDLPSEPGPPSPGDGFCELRSDLIAILYCEKRFGEPPLPMCPWGEWTVIKTLRVAGKPSGRIACQLQYFAPFHRTRVEADRTITEGQEFGLGGGKIQDLIRNNFVKNFRFQDMTIVGDSWLGLQEGCLVGKPPRTGSRQEYQFNVTAENPYGKDSVPLKIIVWPSKKRSVRKSAKRRA